MSPEYSMPFSEWLGTQSEGVQRYHRCDAAAVRNPGHPHHAGAVERIETRRMRWREECAVPPPPLPEPDPWRVRCEEYAAQVRRLLDLATTVSPHVRGAVRRAYADQMEVVRVLTAALLLPEVPRADQGAEGGAP